MSTLFSALSYRTCFHVGARHWCLCRQPVVYEDRWPYEGRSDWQWWYLPIYEPTRYKCSDIFSAWAIDCFVTHLWRRLVHDSFISLMGLMDKPFSSFEPENSKLTPFFLNSYFWWEFYNITCSMYFDVISNWRMAENKLCHFQLFSQGN